jgi:hypothetical protein
MLIHSGSFVGISGSYYEHHIYGAIRSGAVVDVDFLVDATRQRFALEQ